MFLVIDTETTGLPNDRLAADAPGQPRVASVALLYADDDMELQHEWHGLIRPDGWEMPPEAQRINGLSIERLVAEGVTILYPLAMYSRAIDEGRIVVAHNIHFDTKMMRGELRRAGMDDRYGRTQTICTMKLGRRFCSRGNLATVFQELNGPSLEDMGSAHDALNDARACLMILRRLRTRMGEIRATTYTARAA
jgi:DNA polymerase-3 subunit epsilon